MSYKAAQNWIATKANPAATGEQGKIARLISTLRHLNSAKTMSNENKVDDSDQEIRLTNNLPPIGGQENVPEAPLNAVVPNPPVRPNWLDLRVLARVLFSCYLFGHSTDRRVQAVIGICAGRCHV